MDLKGSLSLNSSLPKKPWLRRWQGAHYSQGKAGQGRFPCVSLIPNGATASWNMLLLCGCRLLHGLYVCRSKPAIPNDQTSEPGQATEPTSWNRPVPQPLRTATDRSRVGEAAKRSAGARTSSARLWGFQAAVVVALLVDSKGHEVYKLQYGACPQRGLTPDPNTTLPVRFTPSEGRCKPSEADFTFKGS